MERGPEQRNSGPDADNGLDDCGQPPILRDWCEGVDEQSQGQLGARQAHDVQKRPSVEALLTGGSISLPHARKRGAVRDRGGVGDAYLHHPIQAGAGDARVVVAITGADGQRDGDDLGDAKDQRGEYHEVIEHESPEQVELRPEPGRDAEDHDDHEEPCSHVDRGDLRVAIES